MAFCFKVIVCHFCRCLIVPLTYSFFFAVRNNFIMNVFIGFYSFVLLWYMQPNIFYYKQNNSYMTVCCMRSLVRYTYSTLAINLVFPRTLVLFSMNYNFDNIYPVWLKIYFCQKSHILIIKIINYLACKSAAVCMGSGEATLTFAHANAIFSLFIDRIRNQFLKKLIMK